MDVRKIVSMPEDLVEKIQSYRFSRRINSEAEAIRMLIEKGLEAENAAAPKAKS